MNGVSIAAVFGAVAVLRLWCGYRWSKGSYLHQMYGQQHIPSRNPFLLNTAGSILAVMTALRIYAAINSFFLSVLAAVVAFMAVFFVLAFFGQLGIQLWWIRRSFTRSDLEESRLLGFSSVEQMRRFEAAAAGYSSVDDMRAEQEAAHVRLLKLAEEGERLSNQARAMALSGVPIDKAIEVIGNVRIVESSYREVEASSTDFGVR